jgi:hypothetical protein
MKELGFRICLLISAAVLFACSKTVTPYSGYFEGIIKRDSVTIKVTFDLKPDSTYLITIDFLFSDWCNYKDSPFTFKGKYIKKGDWLVFSESKGISKYSKQEYSEMIVPGYFTQEIKLSKKERKWSYNLNDAGFPSMLKITNVKNGYDKIFFHLNVDCFELIWDNWYVRQTDLGK